MRQLYDLLLWEVVTHVSMMEERKEIKSLKVSFWANRKDEKWNDIDYCLLGSTLVQLQHLLEFHQMFSSFPQFSTSVFLKQSWAWILSARPKVEWGKLQFLFWQHFSSWSKLMAKSVCWLCATHESWLSRSLKSMKGFLNTWITSKFQCFLVVSASRRTSRPWRPTAHIL